MSAMVILLNGIGSAGKSSIARALQDMLSEPWLYVAMDTFLDMMPERLHDDPDGFAYRTVTDRGGRPQVEIETGPTGERLLRGMRRAVAAMATEGNNLIVDDVILGDGLSNYEALLAGFRLMKIGVVAPLDVLEAREAKRPDRMPGLARWQFGRVHAGAQYDLEVDSVRADPTGCAAQIAAHFRLRRKSDHPT